MKKIVTLIMLLCMVYTGAWADYTVNVSGDATRPMNTLCLNDQQIDVSSNRAKYQDLTSSKTFTITAGTEVTPKILWGSHWLAGYVYVDIDKNGAFNTTTTGSSFTIQGDLVSVCQCIERTNGYNNNTIQDFNSFTVTTPGTYRIRYKVDWNNANPNTIEDGTAQIIDVTLNVVAAPKVFPEEGTYYATIKNHETSRNPYLYNSLQYSDDITIQATSLPSPIADNNGYIWKITSNGSGQITEIKNGATGKGITPSGTNGGQEITSFQYTNGANSGYYNLINGSKMGSTHDRLNCADNTDYYHNEANVRAVTTWEGTHNDNEWQINAIDMNGLTVYDVVIEGVDASERAYAEFNGAKAMNGGFFVANSISESNVSAKSITNKMYSVRVEENTVTITYETASLTVTFNYVSNSGIEWSLQKNFADGHTLTESDYAVDFYSNYSVSPSDLVVNESNNTFNITCRDNFPFEAGKLCRIQCIGKNSQTTCRDKDFFVNGASIYYSGSIPTNGNIWYFEHASTTDPYLFKVRNYASKRLLSLTDGTRRAASAVTEDKGTITAPFADNTTYFYVRKNTGASGFSLQHPKYPQTCVSGHITESNSVGGWAADDENTALTNGDNALRILPIESFTTTLNAVPGDGFYGTIYMPFNMETSMAEVYAATASEGIMQLHKVEGVAPAGAYILRIPYAGCAEGEKEAEPITASSETPTTVEHNILSGTLIEGKAFTSELRYALSGKNGIGFYKYQPATYPVAKAVYIPAESTQVAAFYFDFGDPLVTAIKELQKENEESGSIFDLQGRRIQKAQKGMNIINGRKVLR